MKREVVDDSRYVVPVPDRGGTAGGVGLIGALVAGLIAALVQR